MMRLATTITTVLSCSRRSPRTVDMARTRRPRAPLPATLDQIDVARDYEKAVAPEDTTT